MKLDHKDFIFQIQMATGSSSAPPNHKKARKNRGRLQKPNDGKSRSQSTRHFPTDMSPDDYMEILDRTDLRENEKLPPSIMAHWKIVNDQTNFSERVKQGNEVHGNNPAIKFMKQNFLRICEIRPKGTQAESSHRQTT